MNLVGLSGMGGAQYGIKLFVAQAKGIGHF